MSIVVTGATGHLGRLVVTDLLARGVPAGEIVAGTRNLESLSDLAAQGIDVRRIDYNDPSSLATGLEGADVVLLVSGNEFGRRVSQHTAVAQAAKAAGAKRVVYTSAPYAATTSMRLADEHRETEKAIQEVGITYTFLRNGWYFENYTAQIPTFLEHGVVIGAAGDGRISGAARADFAAAAAAVLTTDGHDNAIYELGGDDSFTLAELAAAVTSATGKQVGYQNVSEEELATLLAGTGMPAPMPAILADVDRAVAEGLLFIDSGALSKLTGRPTGTLADAVAAAV